MIDLNESILGVWYVAWKRGDWMAGAWHTPGGPHASYRFRYYEDEKSFGSKDSKSWHDLRPLSGKPIPPDQDLIDALSQMAEGTAAIMEGQKWELLRGTSTFEQFVEQFMKLPFVHSRIIPTADCDISETNGDQLKITIVHKPTGKRAEATGPVELRARIMDAAIEALAAQVFD